MGGQAMPVDQLEREQSVFAVVILGDFNPAIFHPLWYAQNELIPNEEVADAIDVVTSDQVSTFLHNNVHVQVERHRFGLTTKDPSRAPYLRDLAVGTFTLLEHSPLNAIGLNREMRFKMLTADAWNEVGHCLAPKEPWMGILETPGMRVVAMEGKRADCEADQITIRVQPASGLENGVFVAVNQHYNLKKSDNVPVSDRNAEALRILNSDWHPFCGFAEQAAVSLIRQTQVKGGHSS